MEKKTERLIHLMKNAQNEYAEKYLIFPIPHILSKKFVAYCAMKEDLELLLEYIALLRKEESHILKSSLTYSLISLYGKCFTDGSQHSNSKLEPSHLFKEDDTENQEVHTYLMNLRHQFIAHRGETDSEIGIAFMIIPKEGSIDDNQIRFTQLKQNSFSPERLDLIEKTINHIIESLKESIEKNGQKLYENFLKIFTPEQIKLMPLNNAK